MADVVETLVTIVLVLLVVVVIALIFWSKGGDAFSQIKDIVKSVFGEEKQAKEETKVAFDDLIQKISSCKGSSCFCPIPSSGPVHGGLVIESDPTHTTQTTFSVIGEDNTVLSSKNLDGHYGYLVQTEQINNIITLGCYFPSQFSITGKTVTKDGKEETQFILTTADTYFHVYSNILSLGDNLYCFYPTSDDLLKIPVLAEPGHYQKSYIELAGDIEVEKPWWYFGLKKSVSEKEKQKIYAEKLC